MKIEQIYTGCLSQGAYYISSNGEAAIIDPLREVQPYIDRASKDGVKIKYVFETHFHADFVSGHLELSKKTGAPIVYGPTAKPDFKFIAAKDGEEFKLGDVIIKVLHTPGHTMESSCFLLKNENGKDYALFSGDTLFLGDVGRPDLAQGSSMTQDQLAGLLFDSLNEKIMPLADDVIVYPAHGAGSACGKNMMKETVDTLGNQKKVNYALNQPGKDAFIKAVSEGLLPPPGYFGMNVAMNKKGIESFDSILEKGLIPLSPNKIESLMTMGSETIILDVRDANDFKKGFIPRSINIGLHGDFAPWVGALIVDVKQPIILVTNKGEEEESITRLSRVGFDNVIGYLDGGFEEWKNSGKDVDTVDRVSANDLKKGMTDKKSVILDVRSETEYAAEHVEGSFSRPLTDINNWFKTINDSQLFYIHCAGGYRSMVAGSVLKARGIHNFKEIEGGFNAITKSDIPTTDFICQSKLPKS